MARVPSIRIRKSNSKKINGNDEFVLYWMIAQRRAGWNFGLQRATSIDIVKHPEGPIGGSRGIERLRRYRREAFRFERKIMA